MDRELVVEKLKETLPELKEKKLTGLSLSERLETSKIIQQFEITKPLAQVLEKQDEFNKPKNLHVNHGLGSMQFQPAAAALFLCRQAEKVSPEAAVDSLIDIFGKTEADLLCVMSLRGVTCQKNIQLTKTIQMVPLASLPPSWRKLCLTKPDPVDISGESSAFNPFRVKRSDLERVFLITSIKIKPVLFDYETIGDQDSLFPTINEAFISLDEVRLCLTSIGNCSPLEENRWNQFKDEVLEDAANASSRVSYIPIEIIPQRLRKSEPIQEETVVSIVKSYFKLPRKFQNQVIRALDRLNQAMRRSTVGDRAVELSIALESVLLGTERGDNRFKVSLRSGIVFSHDLDKRTQCRKAIKEMYDIRSDLVHNGNDNNSDPRKKDVIEQAITFSAEIIKNLIINGKPPNWTMLELSGKSIKET